MNIAARFCIFLIRGYQIFLSPMLGKNCRFSPTCSEYARQSIERHGVIVGVVLAVRRLIKCGPWHPGGHDPVPEKVKCPIPFMRSGEGE